MSLRKALGCIVDRDHPVDAERVHEVAGRASRGLGSDLPFDLAAQLLLIERHGLAGSALKVDEGPNPILPYSSLLLSFHLCEILVGRYYDGAGRSSVTRESV